MTCLQVCLLYANQPIQSPPTHSPYTHTHTHLLSHTEPLSPCLNHPRAMYWTSRMGRVLNKQDGPCSPKTHCNCSNQPILNLLTLPSLHFPAETIIKTLAYIFPALSLCPDQLWCFPMWPYTARRATLLSGTLSHSYLFNSCPLLIYWPHHAHIIVKCTFQNDTNPHVMDVLQSIRPTDYPKGSSQDTCQ